MHFAERSLIKKLIADYITASARRDFIEHAFLTNVSYFDDCYVLSVILAFEKCSSKFVSQLSKTQLSARI